MGFIGSMPTIAIRLVQYVSASKGTTQPALETMLHLNHMWPGTYSWQFHLNLLF